MAVSRYYRADSVKSYLDSTVTDVGSQVTTTSNPNFPTSYPFTIIVNRDQSNEEVMQVESLEGTVDGKYVWNVTRGSDVEPTMTKQTHNAGSTVEHGVSARDFRESREHEDGDDNVHGLGASDGVVVGTSKSQTLTNKTFSTGTVMPMTYVTGLNDALAGKADDADVAAKANIDSPTFTGTVVLPSTTSIGSVSNTEISYLDGVTSNVQTQLNGKSGTTHTHGNITSTGTLPSGSRVVVTDASGNVTTLSAGTSSTYLRGDLTWQSITSGGTGTVTSVGMTVPTGLSISGSPVTTSGTLAVSYSSGYAIPTTAKQTQWDTAYTGIYASVYVVGGTLTTDGVLSYTSENLKTATGMHSNSTNPSRLIATTAGKYKVSATVRWSRNSTDGTCSTYLTKNGTKIDGTDGAVYISAGAPLQSAHMETIVTLAQNDYVEVYGDVPSASVNYNSTFNIEFVGS